MKAFHLLPIAAVLSALFIAGCDGSATPEEKLETMTRKVADKFDNVPQLSTADLAAWLADSERKPPQLLAHEINHRANVWALRSLNVRWLVSVTAVGSLREKLVPREVVIPDQLVDRTGKGDVHTFFGDGIAAHVGFADPYSAEMRQILLDAARSHTDKVPDGGTYVYMNGPAFSTPAESNMHRALGFDLIGMTNSGEARLCREAKVAMANGKVESVN